MAYNIKEVAELCPEQISHCSPRHIQSVIEDLKVTVATLSKLAQPVPPSEANYVPDHCDRITWRGNYYSLPL